MDKCCGWRPRNGRARFAQFYRKLNLAHGVVSHNKQEWAQVKSVRVYRVNGTSQIVNLKHGSEVADGAWAEVKHSVPQPSIPVIMIGLPNISCHGLGGPVAMVRICSRCSLKQLVAGSEALTMMLSSFACVAAAPDV